MRLTYVFSSLLLIPLMALGANRPGTNAPNASFLGMNVFNANGAAVVPMPVLGASPTIVPLTYRIWDMKADWPILIGGGTTLPGSRPTHSDQSDYTWTNLNTALNRTPAGGRVLYTMAPMPQWATGNSSDANCHLGAFANGLGTCYPPTDWNTTAACQGSLTGTTARNCQVREFVNDLLLHATANGTPIWGLELGNEWNHCESANSCAGADPLSFPSNDGEFIGTMQQALNIVQDAADQARKTQPNIVILSPSVSALTTAACDGVTANGQNWLSKFLNSGGNAFVDYISFHGYSGANPETVNTYITVLNACAGFNKNLYDTEGGWGQGVFNGTPLTSVTRSGNTVTGVSSNHGLTAGNNGATVVISGVTAGSTSWDGSYAVTFVNASTVTWPQTAANDTSTGGMITLNSNLQLQADYITRWHLLQFSRNVAGTIWYAYGSSSWGTICGVWTAGSCSDSRAARTAFGEVYKWIADASPSGACSQNGTVWTCNYTKADGYTSQAVWDTAGSSSYTFPAGYTQYRVWDGTTALLSGTTVTIGTTPILLEQIPRRGSGRGN